MKSKSISSIGEFGLIDIIKKEFSSKTNDKNIIVNIGDDCFCFKSNNSNIFITKDILIENVHFKKEWTTPIDLGEKAIEVNVSDIASMGNVKPKYVFIGLAIPKTMNELFFRNLYIGFKKACDKYGIIISGGDTVKSNIIVISITLIGICNNKRIIRRDSAKVNDLIGVTNTFGNANAGIELLHKYGLNHKYTNNEFFLISKQNNPKSRLKESIILSSYINSLIDSSDSLYTSINNLIKNSNKGANIYIDKIPISYNLKKVFKKKTKQLNFALFGGEDYELIFTVSKSKAKIIKKLIPKITYIGNINLSKKIEYFYNGKKQKIKYSGYKHF
jgi:thiamine-monophosphate kinase